MPTGSKLASRLPPTLTQDEARGKRAVMHGKRLVMAFVLGFAAGPLLGDVDHPCILDPVFPPDCVGQLGRIGTPPVAPADEGFLHVSTPVVDPVVAVPAFDGAPAKLYVLNPLADSVRVLDATDLTVLADLRVCSRPSALARDEAGSRVFVSCHASHAVATIDVRRDLVVQLIQDRDEAGRPVEGAKLIWTFPAVAPFTSQEFGGYEPPTFGENKSNAEGIIRKPYTPSAPISIRILKPGYGTEAMVIRTTKGEPKTVEIVLKQK